MNRNPSRKGLVAAAPALLALGCACFASAAATEVSGIPLAEDPTDKAEQAMLRFINTSWTGDLDGMLERGLIRALVVPSRTMYFSDKGKPRGIAYELLTTFQDELNKKYPPSTQCH
jgi:hypothetical protein